MTIISFLVRGFLLFWSTALAMTVPATGAGGVGKVDVKIVKPWDRGLRKIFTSLLLQGLKNKTGKNLFAII